MNIYSIRAPASAEWLGRCKKSSCEIRYRKSGDETGGKERVKMSNIRYDPEIFYQVFSKENKK